MPKGQEATFAAIQTAMANGWYRPSVPYWPQVSDLINEGVVAVLLEGEPVQPVLDELHRQLEAVATSEGAAHPSP